VPITPRLAREIAGHEPDGPVAPANWKRRWGRIRRDSGATGQDVTRHTFASHFLAAFGEHVFPVLILLGLATRFSALALLGMTAVIQLLVYPGAYPTHGVWASVLLLLMMQGPGKWSLDHWLACKHSVSGCH
jgi:hypothetical protein